jgi:Leucine-rich repeat (LRR) protein
MGYDPGANMRLAAALATAALLGSCADYRVTVNERVVYTPAPLFTGYRIPDPALAECVEQHIADAGVTAAAALDVLNCSHAGVESLAGLEVFSRLVRLKLSRNRIEALQPLADMTALQELHLDGNRLDSIDPVRGLPELEYLDLRDNPQLRCASLDGFLGRPDLELRPPAHCRGRD